jgi:hypothetical protein
LRGSASSGCEKNKQSGDDTEHYYIPARFCTLGSFHRVTFAREYTRVFVRDYTRVGCDARWNRVVRCKLIGRGDDVFTLFVQGLNRDDLSINCILRLREVSCPINFVPRIIWGSDLWRSDRADRGVLWIRDIEDALMFG